MSAISATAAYTASSSVPIPFTALSNLPAIASWLAPPPSCAVAPSVTSLLYSALSLDSSVNFACISGSKLAWYSGSSIFACSSPTMPFSVSSSSGDNFSSNLSSVSSMLRILKSMLVVIGCPGGTAFVGSVDPTLPAVFPVGSSPPCAAGCSPPNAAIPFLSSSIALSKSCVKSVSAIPPLPVGSLLNLTSSAAVSAPGSPSTVMPASP